MGHYDTCREGYCGQCGQTEDKNGKCLSRCQEMKHHENCNTRRINLDQQAELKKDKTDPWVTLVWVVDGKLHTENLRASELQSHEWAEPTKVQDSLILKGKSKIVEVKVGSYILEPR
jgi:hypothetical protein